MLAINEQIFKILNIEYEDFKSNLRDYDPRNLRKNLRGVSGRTLARMNAQRRHIARRQNLSDKS
jgi:hypothetical protein